MSQTLRLLLAGAFALLAHGPARAQTGAVLSGRVARPTADSVLVSWHAQPLDPREQTVGARLNRRGEFRLVVPVAGATLAALRYGEAETPLFLEPGDALELKFKGKDLGASLKFQSADGAAHRPAAAANSYLAAAETAFGNNEAFQVLPDNVALYEAPFVAFLKYRREQQLQLLARAGGPAAFTPAFAAVAQAEIDYLYANDRLTYADLREQVVGTEARLQLTPAYYDFLRAPGLVPGPETAPGSEQYQEFLLNYVHHRVRAAGHLPTDPAYYPACYQLAARTFRGPLRPLLLGRVLLETFRFGHVAHARALLADYAATAQAPPAWLDYLRRDLAAHQALAIGAPAPPLPLRTPEGGPLRLAGYAGRLVYVMFWDSRVPQSQRELPYLQSLLKEFAGKPIVFVSAAFNEGAASRLPLGRTRGRVAPAYVPPPARAQVRQAYGIASLPAFVLLAEDGTVLDPNPKRLSSHALAHDLRAAFGRAAAYRAVSLRPK